MTRATIRGVVLGALACALHSCGGEPPPAPTVALAEPIRGAFTLSREGHETHVRGPRRVEQLATASTGHDGRGAVKLDSGAWALLDRDSAAKIELARITLERGRVWLDASRAEETIVVTPHGTLRARGATVALELSRQSTEVYCGAGEVTYTSRRGNGRFGQGETLKLAASGAPRVDPADVWDDWTGGLADPNPRLTSGPTSVGVLAGRRLDEIGRARVALPVRSHEVKVALDGDFARTEVVQTFFNARSDVLETEYVVLLPRGAIVNGFAVDLGQGFMESQVARLATQNGYELVWEEPTVVARSSLSYDGPDRLRARIYPVAPGSTIRVRLQYGEWLERHGDTRTYVYRMAGEDGGAPPLLGELILDVDTGSGKVRGYRAGMGARVEGRKVVLRKSDFVPRADFYLDIVDEEPPERVARAYVVRPPSGPREAAEGNESYFLLDVPADAPDASEDDAHEPPLELVLLVDLSGSIEPEHLEVARSVVEAVLRQLAPTDRVALRVGDVTAHAPTGASPGLAPATAATREQLLEALARAEIGGATDLGRAMRDAGALVSGKARGTVLYIGDGYPTTGALDRTSLRDQLARIDSPPRFFALGIGDGANMDLLHGLFGEQATQVRERTEASRDTMRILAEAARPRLSAVRIGLASESLYTPLPMAIDEGSRVRLLGRARDEIPKRITMHALRDGKWSVESFEVVRETLDDGGDIRRRWATARLGELLDQDAGREALVDLGVRFGIVTPWTTLVAGAAMGAVTTAVRGFDRDPLEVPWAFGGGGAAADVSALEEARSGWRRRVRRDEPEIASAPEFTWISHVDEAGVAGEAETDSAPASDGGLARAAVERTLAANERGPRGCYERRLTVRPDLSGDVTLDLEVEGSGGVRRADVTASTLGDEEISDCIETEVRGIRFPATGGASVHITHHITFEMPARPLGVRGSCSDASSQPVETRRTLWRERLQVSPGVEGALGVWRDALAQCELDGWRARRTLLHILLKHVGQVSEQVRFYQGLTLDAGVASYLRRAILRSARTPQEVRAVRNGLGMDVSVDWRVFAKQWKANASPSARLALVRRWLDVAPDDLDLQLRLLSLLEQTRSLGEARRLARTLRADPLADARVRTAVGEFWLRQGNEPEARRVFSEIIEHAPLDPWARQRLGDLYRAHGWSDDAYREYMTLARLRPSDGAVMLLLARAAADAGRIDEALRLEQRLGESVEPGVVRGSAAAARLWTTVRLARLAQDANARMQREIRQRERASGALRDPPAIFVALTWNHPDDSPTLWLRHPSTPADVGWERATALAGEHGIEATPVREREAGVYAIEARREELDAIRDTVGQLLVIIAPGTPSERILTAPVRLTRTTRTKRFELRGTTLLEVPATGTGTGGTGTRT